MTTKMKWVLGLCLAVLLGVTACRSGEVRESEPELKYVRVIDVVAPSQRESDSIGDAFYSQHYARAGVLKFADGFETTGNTGSGIQIPFANQMRRIENETGITIDYVVLKDWDELPAKLEEAQLEGVTTIVLFNNSYDGSLLREANSGQYADMEAALQEFGFYDETAYHQTVLKAGVTEKGQVLVPILYNVSGMVQGDLNLYEYEEWQEVAQGHAEDGALDFAAFVNRLKDSMRMADVEELDVPYLSAAFLEDKVDLFLMASGVNLEQSGQQEELFTLLYDYLRCYDETQVKSKGSRVSNQEMYAQYIKDNEEEGFLNSGEPTCMSDKMINQLQIDIHDSGLPEPLLALLVQSMMERTEYFIDCSSAEDVAFHSVFGLLEYRMYYVNREIINDEGRFMNIGSMAYWPIGVLNSDSEYAAQPICYAAVANGGSTRLAAEVLQSMMNQPTDSKYGISVCNSSKDAQLENWKSNLGNPNITKIRKIHWSKDDWMETEERTYWGWWISRLGQPGFIEDKQIFADQVANQIDNIAVAYIPDREVLAIWQDTLTEAVDSGLSAEAGFELLRDRMQKRSIE